MRLPFEQRPADAAPYPSFRLTPSRRPTKRWVWAAIAVAMAVGIASLRIVFPDPDHPYFVLWIVPVLIVAVEFGTAAGVAAALISMATAGFVDGLLVDHPVLGPEQYLFRGAAIIFLGAGFGFLADRLRQSAEAQARFWTLSSDLLTIADRSGYMIRVSPSWTRTLGWSAEELTSRPFLEFVHPDDQEASRAELERVLTRGEGPTSRIATCSLTAATACCSGEPPPNPKQATSRQSPGTSRSAPRSSGASRRQSRTRSGRTRQRASSSRE
jgi:PAS domain-containing protein